MDKRETVNLDDVKPHVVEHDDPVLIKNRIKFSMRIGSRLMFAFLMVGLIPFAVITIISLIGGSRSISRQSFNQLEAMREVKKTQIEKYFDDGKEDIEVLKEIVGTLRREAFNKLKGLHQVKKRLIENYFIDRFKLLDDVQMNIRFTEGIKLFTDAFGLGLESTEYKKLSDEREKGLKVFLRNFGFYDLFLVDSYGNVVYTIAKESDLGANLESGQLKNSGLARVFLKSRHQSAIEDFSWYEPSDQPAAFIATPLIDSSGKYLGSAAFQISLDDLDSVTHSRNGMGNTGDTYIVGYDKRMRSNSYIDPEFRSVAASFAGTVEENGVNTVAVSEAIEGRKGARVIMGYNDNPVISVYSPLEIPGLQWVLIAEINAEEAFCPVDEKGKHFFSKYIDKRGYYDLFLINPDGYCFYSVSRESDYQTNLISGKFSSSNLGRLVRQVLSSKEYGIADFEPYAPSNNVPASFIALPVVYNGEVETIVALQLSIDAINSVMGQRIGIGKTGETYLIGSDMLLRSDSNLDPVNHSVMASFANPEKSKADSAQAKEALSGLAGTAITLNYDGNQVLSAYCPVTVGDTKWALLVEVAEAEAFTSVNKFKIFVTIVAFFCIGTIVIVSIILSRSISRPLVAMVFIVRKIIDGDFSKRVYVDREDEIGVLGKSFNRMIDYLGALITKAE